MVKNVLTAGTDYLLNSSTIRMVDVSINHKSDSSAQHSQVKASHLGWLGSVKKGDARCILRGEINDDFNGDQKHSEQKQSGV